MQMTLWATLGLVFGSLTEMSLVDRWSNVSGCPPVGTRQVVDGGGTAAASAVAGIIGGQSTQKPEAAVDRPLTSVAFHKDMTVAERAAHSAVRNDGRPGTNASRRAGQRYRRIPASCSLFQTTRLQECRRETGTIETGSRNARSHPNPGSCIGSRSTRHGQSRSPLPVPHHHPRDGKPGGGQAGTGHENVAGKAGDLAAVPRKLNLHH